MEKLLCCLSPAIWNIFQISLPHHPSICTKGHFPDSVINPSSAYWGLWSSLWEKIIISVMTEGSRRSWPWVEVTTQVSLPGSLSLRVWGESHHFPAHVKGS